jgi:hypothetical protein
MEKSKGEDWPGLTILVTIWRPPTKLKSEIEKSPPLCELEKKIQFHNSSAAAGRL